MKDPAFPLYYQVKDRYGVLYHEHHEGISKKLLVASLVIPALDFGGNSTTHMAKRAWNLAEELIKLDQAEK